MRRLTGLVALILFSISAFSQTTPPKFKVLRISDSYMVERRLASLGSSGYRVVALGIEGYMPVITLRLNPGHKYEYAFVAIRDLEQNLNKAGQSGYRFRQELMFDNSGKSTVLVERTDGDTRKFEYRIIKPQLPGKIPRLAAEALAQGFTKVAPFSYGAAWEREVGAPAAPERANVEGKLLMPTSSYAKLIERLSKEGREGYRFFTYKDIAVVLRQKGEQRKFDYRVIADTTPAGFEQKLADAQAQGFTPIPFMFETTGNVFLTFVESTGEPVKPRKYTVQKRIDGALAEADPAEILGCGARNDGFWYLLVDASAHSDGHLTARKVVPDNARRIALQDKMEVAFDEANMYVSTAQASWAVPRDSIVEAVYMRGTPLTPGPGFSTPIVAGGPSPIGGIITLASLAIHGATSSSSNKSEEHMEVVVANDDSEYAVSMKASANELPALKSALADFIGNRFTDMLNK